MRSRSISLVDVNTFSVLSWERGKMRKEIGSVENDDDGGSGDGDDGGDDK